MTSNDAVHATAAAVRAEAARQRISGVRLAKKLGVSQSWLNRRMSGVTPFDIAELASVAAVLGVPLSQLVTDEYQPAAS